MNGVSPRRLSIGQCATLACILEVNAPKPGNVHRGADFDDCTLNDFAASAVAIGPVLDGDGALGEKILDCVRSAIAHAGSNTNLGIILLLAPLACVPRDKDLRDGVNSVIRESTSKDSANIYEAIRISNSGGIQLTGDDVSELDVFSGSPKHILDGMREAESRDLIAKQYVNGFHEVFDFVVPLLCDVRITSLVERIVHAHVMMMHKFPDSLICRKCGTETVAESAARAGAVLEAGEVGSESYVAALTDLDFWLRSDGNRRNPGTTADMIAAGLFAVLRDELISKPYH